MPEMLYSYSYEAIKSKKRVLSTAMAGADEFYEVAPSTIEAKGFPSLATDRISDEDEAGKLQWPFVDANTFWDLSTSAVSIGTADTPDRCGCNERSLRCEKGFTANFEHIHDVSPATVRLSSRLEAAVPV